MITPTETTSRPRYTRKELSGNQPTWCPGCGDYSILSIYLKLMEKRQVPLEKIVSVSGIGCSSRFPYFVNAHGAHFLHGRALPFASGISLSRPDLHVFVFTGDGDALSIGGNHLDHAARKNIRMTCVIMDNSVYGLTKHQTSPTSPVGFRSKTDPSGSVDRPVNAMKKLIAAGATFVARTNSHMPNHVLDMMERAIDHDGFSVIHCLSECAQFYPGAYDKTNPRKGGVFELVPADHDSSDELAAYKLAMAPFPGYFGVIYQTTLPTKNELEARLIAEARLKTGNASALEAMTKTLQQFC